MKALGESRQAGGGRVSTCFGYCFYSSKFFASHFLSLVVSFLTPVPSASLSPRTPSAVRPRQEHGFLLNIDTKWRTHPDISTVPRHEWEGHPSVGELYCLAISHQRGIRTLRDLRAKHVPMLKEIYG